MAQTLDHGRLMDNVYRRQRHIYDATRKYFLLGRDPMLAGLAISAGGTALEIGCGTGRNLIKAATLYPGTSLFGIDISGEMLDTAGASVAANGLSGRIRLAQSDAARFDPEATFGRKTFDRVFVSYAVSMIPSWQAILAAAIQYVAPGGTLHVVDFGDLAGLPGWSKAMLGRWLKTFHVTPREDLFAVASGLAAGIGGTFEANRLHRGYAWIAIVRRP